jgi:EAL domain-containing protein (putative c-di-GMP-specific phosphodiesterase class I)
MLTGAGNEEVAVRALNFGVYDYLRKENLAREQLIESINTAFLKHNEELVKQREQERISKAFDKGQFYRLLEHPSGTETEGRIPALLLIEVNDPGQLASEYGLIMRDNLLRHVARQTYEKLKHSGGPCITRLGEASVGVIIDFSGSRDSLESEIQQLWTHFDTNPYMFVDKPVPFTTRTGALIIDRGGNTVTTLIEHANRLRDEAGKTPGNSCHISLLSEILETENRRRQEEEQKRKAEEEAEQERLRREEEQRRKDEEDRLRIEEEKRKAADAERLRQETERKRSEEEQRRKEEAERLRIEEEKRKAVEAERQRLAELEKRLKEEEQRRRQEEEQLRQQAAARQEAEAERKRQEQEQRKAGEVAEKRRIQMEDEQQRREAEARKTAEAEKLRVAEQEKLRLEEEKRQAEDLEKQQQETEAGEKETQQVHGDEIVIDESALDENSLILKKAFNENRVIQTFQPVIALFTPETGNAPSMFKVDIEMVDEQGNIKASVDIDRHNTALSLQQFIDRWILREIIGRIVNSEEFRKDRIYLITISEAWLADVTLFNWLKKLLTGLENIRPGNSIALELPASMLIKHKKRAMALTKALKQSHGFEIAIGKVETADELKSLAGLKDFDLLTVKWKLVDELRKNTVASSDIAIISALKSRGTHLIFDGIEDSTMLTEAISLGTDYVMGSFIGEPQNSLAATGNVETFDISY